MFRGENNANAKFIVYFLVAMLIYGIARKPDGKKIKEDCVRSVVTISVKILRYRPPARLKRVK